MRQVETGNGLASLGHRLKHNRWRTLIMTLGAVIVFSLTSGHPWAKCLVLVAIVVVALEKPKGT
jgi:hypothetical protein